MDKHYCPKIAPIDVLRLGQNGRNVSEILFYYYWLKYLPLFLLSEV